MNQTDYFMHRSIMEQPTAFKSILTSHNKEFSEASHILGNSKNIFLIGTGSSLHAAMFGRFILEKYVENKNIMVYSSFEFSNYTPDLSRDDTVIVISHRGYKMYSYDSLKKARNAGCKTVAITGVSSSIKKGDADFIFTTVEQEKSSAHTISLTSAVAVLLKLAASSKLEATQEKESLEKLAESIVPGMEKALKLEKELKDMSKKMDFSQRVWIFGGGPNSVTAMEAALKMQETSYVTAYGYEIEQLIHGPVRAADLSHDIFICISTWGKSYERIQNFAKALRSLNVSVIEITDRNDSQEKNLVSVQRTEEEFSPLINLIVLQLLSLSVAVARGKNPDNFRSDNSAFARLDEMIKL
ncbi:SIS domain-containing protein [Oxyplasma meridianum]|uniref:SIS domain-containing protein n=1 Tax=Oxyplasma meridianum TaxID=3073602 RepID=A0AAX4NGA5_9ARCH